MKLKPKHIYIIHKQQLNDYHIRYENTPTLLIIYLFVWHNYIDILIIITPCHCRS